MEWINCVGAEVPGCLFKLIVAVFFHQRRQIVLINAVKPKFTRQDSSIFYEIMLVFFSWRSIICFIICLPCIFISFWADNNVSNLEVPRPSSERLFPFTVINPLGGVKLQFSSLSHRNQSSQNNYLSRKEWQIFGAEFRWWVQPSYCCCIGRLEL